MKFEGMIGMMDSGVGGISVLKDCIKQLPHEKFIFYGDSANAPYGEKTIEEVQRLTLNVVDYLFSEGVKAVVIACNTATSAAIQLLREKYSDRIVIGVEPALKPAVMDHHQDILVMATANTLKLEKFQRLNHTYGRGLNVQVCACNGLAARIEKGNLDAPDLITLIESLVGHYKDQIDSVVLGCTHYPHIKSQIKQVLGNVPFYDGGVGTARELEHQLETHHLLNDDTHTSRVIFESSKNTDEELALYQQFLEL